MEDIYESKDNNRKRINEDGKDDGNKFMKVEQEVTLPSDLWYEIASFCDTETKLKLRLVKKNDFMTKEQWTYLFQKCWYTATSTLTEDIPVVFTQIHVCHTMSTQEWKYMENIKALKIDGHSGYVDFIFDDHCVAHLGNLEKLYLNCSILDFKVTDKELKHLKKLKKLKKLCINGTSTTITDEGLKWLEGIENLELYNCTCITDEGLKYLKGIRRLELDWW